MIAISLLLIAGGAIGAKLHRSIEKKRFTSSLDRLKTRLSDCRQLALNMQADWKGALYHNEDKWVFEAYTLDEAKMNRFLPLKLESFDLYWNGNKIDQVSFLFASGGEVRVEKEATGTFLFKKNKDSDRWEIPLIFRLDESPDGSKSGPQHPDVLQ